MKKGFVISWYYPPGNSSEGLVTYKLLKNSKFAYDVWTRDNSQQNIWDRKVKEDHLSSPNVRILKGACDTNKQWVDEAVSYFLQHRSDYDFIMSRSMIVEDHEIALKIKSVFPDIKWIASFGDPIINTPYIDEITMHGQSDPFLPHRPSRKYLSRELRLQSALWRIRKKEGDHIYSYFNRINTETLRLADSLIYSNSYQLEHAFQDDRLAPFRPKAAVIEHSFDSSLYPKKPRKDPHVPLRFIYVGHLDNLRNIKNFLMALSRLNKEDDSLAKKIRCDFYGHLDDSDKALIIDQELYDIVKVHGAISYADSLSEIQKSDWGLLVDADFSDHYQTGIFLPAKLMDYLGAGVKVFSISYPKGASSDIINDCKVGVVTSFNQDAIYLALKNVLSGNCNSEPPRKKQIHQFAASVQATKLDKIITSL